MSSPIRVATAVLSGRIFAGRPTKDGLGFREPRYDVTSDVLVAVKDKIEIDNQITVECDGVPQFRIAILPAEPTPEEIVRSGAADMLDVLQLAERFVSGFEDDPIQIGTGDLLIQMRAVIAKATGQ